VAMPTSAISCAHHVQNRLGTQTGRGHGTGSARG
jgi:hypothetical protein